MQDGADELLPAGLYWVGYDTCDGCPRPNAATAAIVENEAAARAALAQLPPGLPLGYPLVVHTDELGLADRSVRGIALVLGLHRSPAQGVQWLRILNEHVPEARVFLLGAGESWVGGVGRTIARIAAGAPVPAYERAAVAELENQQSDEIEPEVLAARLQPLCTVEPGEIFLAQVDDLEWYRWAPVRCGDQPAYVTWRATLLGWATVIPTDDGYRLRQVTHVECDQPDIEEWPYDGETGRGRVAGGLPGALGGC